MRKFDGLPIKKGCLHLQTTLILLLFFAKSLAYSTFALPLKVKGNNVYNF